MTTVTVNRLDPADQGQLFCCYPGQESPQPVYVHLDFEAGELSIDYAPDRNSMSEAVHSNRADQWLVVPLTATAANELLAELVPLAQRVVDGAQIEWDGQNRRGRLTEDAVTAHEEIGRRLDGDQGHPLGWPVEDQVAEFDAADWFEHGDLSWLTPSTSDARIEAAAREAEQEAAQAGQYGYTLLRGAEVYLRDRRAELQAEAADAE